VDAPANHLPSPDTAHPVIRDLLYGIARPLLFRLDPEDAHNLTLRSLKSAQSLGLGRLVASRIPDQPRTVMGLRFPNPIGLAAGLDKNGSYIEALSKLGFGFIEVGTVTPRPQGGNPRPRLFRLPREEALINRMGFNNSGLETVVHNISTSKYRGILGVNIGKNKDTAMAHAADDYLTCLRGVYPHASYIVVNVSSPNTKDLRQLQDANALDALLSKLKGEHARLSDQHGRYVPLALKIAPDIGKEQITEIASTAVRHRVDALIATNTTISRTGLSDCRHAEEAGGLSGAPLCISSNSVIRVLKRCLEGAIPIIGVGGILSGSDARSKIDAGADLVQLYTGLVYRGPGLIAECARALRQTPSV